MARGRARRAARVNRVGLTAVGTLLLAAGLAALAAGAGLLGPGTAGTPLLSDAAAEVLARRWVPYAAMAAFLLAGFLSLRWLLVQGTGDALGGLVLERSPSGRVEIAESVARSALERQVAAYPGVRRVGARLTESCEEPHLRLALLLDGDADVAAVWRRIRSEALADLGRALEADRIPAVVRMSMAARTGPPRRTLL